LAYLKKVNFRFSLKKVNFRFSGRTCLEVQSVLLFVVWTLTAADGALHFWSRGRRLSVLLPGVLVFEARGRGDGSGGGGGGALSLAYNRPLTL
jgi:hypothetical protein